MTKFMIMKTHSLKTAFVTFW